MKVVTGKDIRINKCVDSDSILTGPNCKVCKDCDLPIHVKCAIAMGLIWEKNYCSHDCMRNDEMRNTGYLFKCVTRYDDEDLFCYLSEVDTIQDVISQFLEMVMDKKIQPSKYYGARLSHKGKELSPVDKIFPIFSKKFDNIVILLYRKKLKGIIN